jgi:hypothetical protein
MKFQTVFQVSLTSLVLGLSLPPMAAATPKASAATKVTDARPIAEVLPPLPGATGLDLMVIPGGGYLMVAALPASGIVMGKADGVGAWTLSPQVVVGTSQENNVVELAHPSIVRLGPDGLRIYYQARTTPGGPAHIRSAFSRDGGTTWTTEGVRMQGSSSNGFGHIGAPAVWQRARGFAMIVAANRSGQNGPSDLYMATSQDGLTWTMMPNPLVRGAHSAAVGYLKDVGLVVVYTLVNGTRQLQVTDNGGDAWDLLGDMRLERGQSQGPTGDALLGDNIFVPSQSRGAELLVPTSARLVRYVLDSTIWSEVHPLLAPSLNGPRGAGPGDAPPAMSAPPMSAPAEKPIERVVVPPAPLAATPAAMGTVGGQAVRSWYRQINTIASPQGRILAPDVVPLPGGGWRMYYTLERVGVGSSTSKDGITWVAEEGARLRQSAIPGDQLGLAGHPTVIATGDTLRMYFQGGPAPTPGHRGQPQLSVWSAASTDGGKSFTVEGTAIAPGEETGLSLAAHGRAWRTLTGGFGMLFSADPLGRGGPSDVYRATSPDGLDWQVDPAPLFIGGHDPSLIRLDDGRLLAAYAHLADEFRMSWSSDDGRTWSKPTALTFLGRDGDNMRPSDIAGDLTMANIPGRGLVYYVNNGGTIAIYEAVDQLSWADSQPEAQKAPPPVALRRGARTTSQFDVPKGLNPTELDIEVLSPDVRLPTASKPQRGEETTGVRAVRIRRTVFGRTWVTWEVDDDAQPGPKLLVVRDGRDNAVLWWGGVTVENPPD